MRCMTIRTTGNPFRIAESIVFSMITIHVSAGCHIEDLVSFHHLLITVAFQTDFGMKHAVGMELGVIHRFDVMEIMTITANCRILIAYRDGCTMNGLAINGFLVMALNALGNDYTLIIFPVLVRVDVGMAIGTFNILLNMHAVVMFGIFLFVTTLATDLLYFSLTFHMSGKISELDMTAVTAILAMNGRDKRSGRDFIAVAAKTGDWINGHTLLGPEGIASQ